MQSGSADEKKNKSKPRATRTEQARSRQTKSAIVDATIALIAKKGVGAVTHRAVAEQGGVSLANTTYHFASKQDLIRQAYRQIIGLNTVFLSKTLADSSQQTALSMDEVTEFLTFVSIRQMTERRDTIIAWFELMLEAARHEDMRALANDWYAASAEYWRSFVGRTDAPNPDQASRFVLSFLIGKYFYLISQGAPQAELLKMRASFSFLSHTIHGRTPSPSEAAPGLDTTQSEDVPPPMLDPAPSPKQSRSELTRNQILDAAVRLIAQSGPAGIKMRDVAGAAGVSLAATTYHFRSRQHLIDTAYQRIYESEMDQYGDWSQTLLSDELNTPSLVQGLTDYFVEEATISRERALGNRELLVEAARAEHLRPYSVRICSARRQFWERVFSEVGSTSPRVGADVLLSMVAGRFILMISLGGEYMDPEMCHRDFTYALNTILPELKDRSAR